MLRLGIDIDWIHIDAIFIDDLCSILNDYVGELSRFLHFLSDVVHPHWLPQMGFKP